MERGCCLRIIEIAERHSDGRRSASGPCDGSNRGVKLRKRNVAMIWKKEWVKKSRKYGTKNVFPILRTRGGGFAP